MSAWLALLALAGMADEVELTPEEVAILCIIAPAASEALPPGGEEAEYAGGPDLRQAVDGWNWKNLPRKVKCADKSLRLRPSGYGRFLDSMAFSPDGGRVAVSGGYQATPLGGGGGYCLFERRDGGWRRLGCVHTWDS
jgi:hypothetical protein